MTIPGRGDLAPRRRHHRIWRYLLILVVIALLAGGGYAGYRALNNGSSTPSTSGLTLPACHGPGTSTVFAPDRQVRVRVFNASLRTGLAAEVKHTLERRGFHVTQIGNALRVGHDVATIQYSPDQKKAASTVAAQISGAATMKPVTGTRVLELDIGVRFARLRSASGARAVERHRVAAVLTAPTPSHCVRPGSSHAHG